MNENPLNSFLLFIMGQFHKDWQSEFIASMLKHRKLLNQVVEQMFNFGIFALTKKCTRFFIYQVFFITMLGMVCKFNHNVKLRTRCNMYKFGLHKNNLIDIAVDCVIADILVKEIFISILRLDWIFCKESLCRVNINHKICTHLHKCHSSWLNNCKQD